MVLNFFSSSYNSARKTKQIERVPVKPIIVHMPALAAVAALAATAAASIVIPEQRGPNVWGGAAYGAALGHSSHLFAFAAADGAAQEGSGFTGLLTPTRWVVQFRGSTLRLSLGAGSDMNGTLSVASSDVVVVNGAGGGTPQLVLAYAAWDVLVGYAPQSSLALTELQLAPSACNIIGGWVKGALPNGGGASGQEGIKGMAKKGQPPYEILENADGSFTATAASPPSSWKTGSG